MQDPIQQMMDEHRVIERVLDALEAAADRDVALDFYSKAVDFIANFADGLHHAKEEERFFPVLEQKGIPRDGGPIGVMLAEHEMGRGFVARMRAGIEAEDRDAVRAASLEYAALLRAHIQKEDQVLFPMGRMRLSEGEVAAVRARFDEVDAAGEIRGRYEKLCEDLRGQAGL